MVRAVPSSKKTKRDFATLSACGFALGKFYTSNLSPAHTHLDHRSEEAGADLPVCPPPSSGRESVAPQNFSNFDPKRCFLPPPKERYGLHAGSSHVLNAIQTRPKRLYGFVRCNARGQHTPQMRGHGKMSVRLHHFLRESDVHEKSPWVNKLVY